MEYLPSPTSQTICFIYSAGLGFALGLVYDFFRIFFYTITGSDKKLRTVRDIMYLSLCLAVDFIFLLVMCSGRIMLYVFVGEGIGLTVYARTFSRAVYRPLKVCSSVIRRFFLRYAAIFGRIKLFMRKITQNIQKNAKKQEKISEKT